jgi:hypothetical protein
MIPPCFLFAYALSVSLESGMRAAASVVGDCCRREPWLLKYIIYVMVKPQRFAEHFCFSLRPSALSAVFRIVPENKKSLNERRFISDTD